MKVESVPGATAAAAGPAPAASAVPASAATASGDARPVAGPQALTAGAKSADATQGIKPIADEFERLLLMQMLRTSKVCGDEKGYGSMLVDSLADGVMRGGGLGLSATIVRSLERSVAASQGAETAAPAPAAGATSASQPPGEEKLSPSPSSPRSVVRSSG